MNLLFRKNEAEINERVAKGLLYLFACIFLIMFLCWIGIFDIHIKMTLIILGVAVVTLIIPSFLILKMRIYRPAMKYYIVAALAVLAGAAYVLFTFQAVLVFLVPTVIAAFYKHKGLMYYSAVVTVVVLFVSHIITGFYVFMPWIEPFVGLGEIIRYGALPRCIQYAGCFLMLLFLVDRNLGVEQVIQATREPLDEDKREYEELLSRLTEREQSVFELLVAGYTNMQIADKLYLSNGTVKNYISVIYEKIETKERNALILKYSRFVKEYD